MIGLKKTHALAHLLSAAVSVLTVAVVLYFVVELGAAAKDITLGVALASPGYVGYYAVVYRILKKVMLFNPEVTFSLECLGDRALFKCAISNFNSIKMVVKKLHISGFRPVDFECEIEPESSVEIERTLNFIQPMNNNEIQAGSNGLLPPGQICELCLDFRFYGAFKVYSITTTRPV